MSKLIDKFIPSIYKNQSLIYYHCVLFCVEQTDQCASQGSLCQENNLKNCIYNFRHSFLSLTLDTISCLSFFKFLLNEIDPDLSSTSHTDKSAWAERVDWQIGGGKVRGIGIVFWFSLSGPLITILSFFSLSEPSTTPSCPSPHTCCQLN